MGLMIMFGGNDKEGHYRIRCTSCGKDEGELFCKGSKIVKCKKCGNCWTRNNIGQGEPIKERID